MEIIEPRAAMLSNYEVLALIQEQKAFQEELFKSDPKTNLPENLMTIQFEVSQYLENSKASKQSPKQIQSFLQALRAWKLTKAEKLEILNLCPKSVVELHLLIEECEDRFNADELEQLLDIIKETFPINDEEMLSEANGDGDDDDAEE